MPEETVVVTFEVQELIMCVLQPIEVQRPLVLACRCKEVDVVLLGKIREVERTKLKMRLWEIVYLCGSLSLDIAAAIYHPKVDRDHLVIGQISLKEPLQGVYLTLFHESWLDRPQAEQSINALILRVSYDAEELEQLKVQVVGQLDRRVISQCHGPLLLVEDVLALGPLPVHQLARILQILSELRIPRLTVRLWVKLGPLAIAAELIRNKQRRHLEV